MSRPEIKHGIPWWDSMGGEHSIAKSYSNRLFLAIRNLYWSSVTTLRARQQYKRVLWALISISTRQQLIIQIRQIYYPATNILAWRIYVQKLGGFSAPTVLSWTIEPVAYLWLKLSFDPFINGSTERTIMPAQS